MIKREDIKEAVRLASLLALDCHVTSEFNERDVLPYHDIMSTANKVREMLRLLDPTSQDMRLCRIMVAAELSRPAGPRLPLVMALVRRHEDLNRAIRLEPFLHHLPGLAAAMERECPPPKANPVIGSGLQAALTGALHGPRLCAAEDDKPCRLGCESGECQTKAKKRLLALLPVSAGFNTRVGPDGVRIRLCDETKGDCNRGCLRDKCKHTADREAYEATGPVQAENNPCKFVCQRAMESGALPCAEGECARA